MLDIRTIRKESDFELTNGKNLVKFLHKHLGRFSDPERDIQKSLDYAFSNERSEGGFALAAFHDAILVGGLIMNRTGMSGYIPENILVYIAVDGAFRGRGFGSQIIKKAFEIMN